MQTAFTDSPYLIEVFVVKYRDYIFQYEWFTLMFNSIKKSNFVLILDSDVR